MALAECNCHDVIVIDLDRGVDFVRRQNSNAASLPEEEEALEVTRTGASVPTWTWVHGGRCAPPPPFPVPVCDDLLRVRGVRVLGLRL